MKIDILKKTLVAQGCADVLIYSQWRWCIDLFYRVLFMCASKETYKHSKRHVICLAPHASVVCSGAGVCRCFMCVSKETYTHKKRHTKKTSGGAGVCRCAHMLPPEMGVRWRRSLQMSKNKKTYSTFLFGTCLLTLFIALGTCLLTFFIFMRWRRSAQMCAQRWRGSSRRVARRARSRPRNATRCVRSSRTRSCNVSSWRRYKESVFF